MVNELSVFNSLMFYCIFMMITGEFRTKQTRPKQDCLFNGSLPERLRGIPCVLQYWKKNKKTKKKTHTHVITLYMLWANSADDKLMLFFVFFFKKIGYDTSCKLSSSETICIRCQILFSRKVRKIFQNVVCWNLYLACKLTDSHRPTFRNQQTGKLYFICASMSQYTKRFLLGPENASG